MLYKYFFMLIVNICSLQYLLMYLLNQCYCFVFLSYTQKRLHGHVKKAFVIISFCRSLFHILGRHPHFVFFICMHKIYSNRVISGFIFWVPRLFFHFEILGLVCIHYFDECSRDYSFRSVMKFVILSFLRKSQLLCVIRIGERYH